MDRSSPTSCDAIYRSGRSGLRHSDSGRGGAEPMRRRCQVEGAELELVAGETFFLNQSLRLGVCRG